MKFNENFEMIKVSHNFTQPKIAEATHTESNSLISKQINYENKNQYYYFDAFNFVNCILFTRI